MKKLLVILFILVSVFVGLSLGDNSYTKSKIMEEELDHFEEEIQKPNNYEHLEFKPKSNIFNKLANAIEKSINAVFEKISDKL